MLCEKAKAASDPAADLKRLADAMEKLLPGIERLRRDITRLGDRIKPVDGEVMPSEKDPLARPSGLHWVFEKITLRKLGDMVLEMEVTHCGMDRDVRAIKARMDVIENDVLSRDEMKSWLKR